MLWLLLALVAHAGNALVFVVDKSLLATKSTFSDPLRLTFYSSLLAGAAMVLLLFSYTPLTSFILSWTLLAGVLHLAALWGFFTALKQGEPSRVVPVVGSAVPLFTFVLAVTLLGESLALRDVAAVVLLIIGGALLSIRLGDRGFDRRVLAAMLLAGVFFAAYFAAMKHIYGNTSVFLAVFAYSRVVEAATALVVLGPVVWFQWVTRRGSAAERLQRSEAVGWGRRRGRTQRWLMPSIFVGNKTLAAGAFILQNYAISLGSVTVVNALQGTQYLAVLLLAAAVSIWWPKLWREELHRVALSQKVAGIVLVSFGIALLL